MIVSNINDLEGSNSPENTSANESTSSGSRRRVIFGNFWRATPADLNYHYESKHTECRANGERDSGDRVPSELRLMESTFSTISSLSSDGSDLKSALRRKSERTEIKSEKAGVKQVRFYTRVMTIQPRTNHSPVNSGWYDRNDLNSFRTDLILQLLRSDTGFDSLVKGNGTRRSLLSKDVTRLIWNSCG